MSRSTWAAALGASVFTLAATLSASPSALGQPASTHADQASYPVPIIHHIVPVQTPTLRQPTQHAHAITRQRHPAARTLAQPQPVLLAPGSGYRQAAGSGPVRRLQRRLTGLGFSPGPIDGRYGPLTTQAVERFQSADGLNVDGIIGPRSLAALNAKPGQASAGLRLGVGYRLVAGSGPVRVLQRRLASLGFAPGPIDGRYGPLTTRAVKRFQSARRLAVNGVVGAGTLHAILTAGRRSTITVSSQPPPSPPPHRTTQERSTTPAESAPVNRQSPPTLPVAPVLLALAALGIAATLLHSGRTRSREHHQRARGEPTPRGFASELADAHDADPGTRGYRR